MNYKTLIFLSIWSSVVFSSERSDSNSPMRSTLITEGSVLNDFHGLSDNQNSDLSLQAVFIQIFSLQRQQDEMIETVLGMIEKIAVRVDRIQEQVNRLEQKNKTKEG